MIYILSFNFITFFTPSFSFTSCFNFRKIFILFFHIFFYSNTGFLCLVIYRRDTHVVELQIGNLTSRLEDACTPDQFDPTRTPFTTLLCELLNEIFIHYFFIVAT